MLKNDLIERFRYREESKEAAIQRIAKILRLKAWHTIYKWEATIPQRQPFIGYVLTLQEYSRRGGGRRYEQFEADVSEYFDALGDVDAA